MDLKGVFGEIGKPPQLDGFAEGSAGLSQFLDNIVAAFFSVAALAFIIMFVWGVVQMILSGGDKEAVAKARSKITWAIIGIVLMSLSYFIFSLLQAVTGVKFFVD